MEGLGTSSRYDQIIVALVTECSFLLLNIAFVYEKIINYE